MGRCSYCAGLASERELLPGNTQIALSYSQLLCGHKSRTPGVRLPSVPLLASIPCTSDPALLPGSDSCCMAQDTAFRSFPGWPGAGTRPYGASSPSSGTSCRHRACVWLGTLACWPEAVVLCFRGPCRTAHRTQKMEGTER